MFQIDLVAQNILTINCVPPTLLDVILSFLMVVLISLIEYWFLNDACRSSTYFFARNILPICCVLPTRHDVSITFLIDDLIKMIEYWFLHDACIFLSWHLPPNIFMMWCVLRTRLDLIITFSSLVWSEWLSIDVTMTLIYIWDIYFFAQNILRHVVFYKHVWMSP